LKTTTVYNHYKCASETPSENREVTKKNHPDLSWLENPQVFAINRLPAHSDHTFYPSMEAYHEKKNLLKQSLNGEWRIQWSKNPNLRPETFMKPDYDISSFDTITVPGHMELAGYGQIQYTNTAYPWDGHCFLRPPFIDWDNNPVGSYVREFDLDKNLLGKRVCLSFQGAEEAIYVWLNGNFVGYGEDSFTPSDFDVTEWVLPKGNRLCVEVYKKSSASWIEDQDFFRFSGLFREVFLYGKPDVHIENLKISADYHATEHSGMFSIEAELSGNAWSKVLWTLEDIKNGTLAANGTLTANKTPSAAPDSFQKLSLKQTTITEVHPWNVGNPYLYRLLIQVLDIHNTIVEIVPYDIGFRHFEISNNIMLLNGQRLLVNGVNRHEWSPKTGRAITESDMREDIREVEIKYTYLTATHPETTVEVAYRINACGRMKVSLSYKGNPELPDLPVFGLRMYTSAPLLSYSWDGLSGETYPDRYKGASFGTHMQTVEIPSYLVPQECGNHKDTLRMEAGDMIFLMCEKPFHFSILPYSQQELESAFHVEELPCSERSVISILGAVRGVGGIDSWGSDVEEAYHVSGKEDLEFSFYLMPRLQYRK